MLVTSISAPPISASADRTFSMIALLEAFSFFALLVISNLKTVDKVEVLPYHDMGKYKWTKLALKYELENVRTANDEDIKRAKKILGIS